MENFTKQTEPIEAGTENLNVDFISIRENVQRKLDEVNTYLVPFHLDNSVSLKNLKHYLANDSLRLAVLGGLKRGISTLINAIIGEPGLMPTGTLPCTSALVEIKYGDKPLYQVNNDGTFGSFRLSTREEFQSKTGGAAKSRINQQADNEAERVPWWRVHIPSPFLKGSFISLIDSPGIGEDYARNRISQAEAERADAAIIVLNADQLTSTDELELIEKMKSKASNLILAINRADNVPESEWDELKNHAIERINDVTNRISEENIVFISAKMAEEAIKNSILDDPWIARLENMKEIIHNRLIKNAGSIKWTVLKDKVDDFVNECQEMIDEHCQLKEKDFEMLQWRERSKKDAEEFYLLAKLAVEMGERILKDSEDTENKFIKFFWENLPKILEETEKKKPEWTSEYSLAKPKKHVEEVAKKAQKELLTNFENWVREEGAPFITELVDQKYQEAENKLAALNEYLKQTTGVNGITQINKIKKQVFIDTFGDIDFEISGRIAGVVAVVYAIADIILYHLLSLIAGFLNPFLIAAAVIVAHVGFFTVGKGGIKALVRNKVFSKIDEELKSDKNKEKIDRGLKEAISSMFKKMADSFKENAAGVLNEAKLQQIAREREMKKFIDSKGVSPEAIKQELAKMKTDAENAKKALDELTQCIEPNLNIGKGEMENFTKRIETLDTLISQAASSLHELELEHHIHSLKEAANNQEFRVSVLGRFKHGKSSVINTLLNQDISPKATLPCTSRIIEFKYGRHPCFYRCNNGQKIKSTEEEFKKDSTIKGAFSSSTDYWQVMLPVSWLGSSITLVDTPGTDEDKARLEISEKELRRSDAALVILKADQLGGLDDVELIEDLQSRIGCVIVLVNRMDKISPDERDSIMEYAANLLEPIGIHPSAILPFSAKTTEHKPHDVLEMIQNTHRSISQTLLKDVGGAKLMSLMNRTEHLIEEITPHIEKVIHTSEANLKTAEESNNKAKKHHQENQALLQDVIQTIQRTGYETANNASYIFKTQWKQVVSNLKYRKDSWYSDRDPLFSPKIYATEIGEDAKRSLEKMVENSVRVHLQPAIESNVTNMQRKIRTELSELLSIASSVGLGDLEDIERRLFKGVTRDAFGDSVDNAALDAATGAAIIAVVSGIIGYIIADIILFYILGIISGFLNPFLLIAAASLGVFTYVFKGKDAVGGWIKGKIADKLTDKLSSDEVTNKIVSTVKDSTIDLFNKLSNAYEKQISSLIKKTAEKIDETESERERHQEKLVQNLCRQKEAQDNLNNIIFFLKEEVTNLEKERMALIEN